MDLPLLSFLICQAVVCPTNLTPFKIGEFDGSRVGGTPNLIAKNLNNLTIASYTFKDRLI